jgi:hypothetical protein
MFTDIQAFSKLAALDEDSALDLLFEHNRMLIPILEKANSDEVGYAKKSQKTESAFGFCRFCRSCWLIQIGFAR